MNNNYLENIDQLFEKNNLSTDGLKGFFDESLTFIQQLHTKLLSEDPEIRNEALQASLNMKDKLEGKLKEICEKNGIDLNELTGLSQAHSEMNPEEQKAMNEMEQKLQTFKIGHE